MAAKDPATKPLRRDAEENRRRLLAAAKEVFAESGLDPTMDEIAARAGLGVGTAYRRFANKDELIAALFEQRIGELAVVMDRALAEEDPWRGVVSYLEGTVALTAGDRGFRELMLAPPAGIEFVDEARAQVGPQIDELVSRAHAAGRLRPGIEPTDLVSVVLMLAQVADYGHEREQPPWHRYLELFLGGIEADAGTPLPGTALSPAEQDQMLRGQVPPRRSGRD